MKRGLIIVVMLMFLLVTSAYAQRRGALTNAFASWYNVTNNTLTTITLPSTSRDIYIRNGSSNELAVSLTGETIDGDGAVAGQHGGYRTDSTYYPQTVIVDADADFTLRDYVTSSITMMGVGADCSPVTVVITY